MKILVTFLLFVTITTGNAVFAQAYSYTVSDYSDSITGCLKQLDVAVSTGPNDESHGIVTVDWGDGAVSSLTFATNGIQDSMVSNIVIYTHGYSVAGNYTATVNVYSTTLGANVDAGQSFNFSTNDPSNCGYIYLDTYQQAPSITYDEAQYDFTDVNGVTTTISQDSNPNTSWGYTGLNVANIPYTVSINDAWLTTNGLVQVSPDFTITTFDPSGIANPSQMSIEVDCAVAETDPDVVIAYAYALAFVAPLQTGSVEFNLCNYTCDNTTDAHVSLEFPAFLTPNTAGLTNATVNGNILTFDVFSLSNCNSLHIPFTFPGNVFAGTPLEFYLNVSAANDTDLTSNTDTLNTIVLNSYDPNNKLVNKLTSIDVNQDETLHYVINFQNEGNMAASDVVIRDTIDTDLDLSTFAVLGSKHVIVTSVDPTTRIVTFSFNEINLAPASQDEEGSKGYVVYSIRENAELPLGSEIENTAYIYFDFNPPIITNTAYNINAVLTTNELTTETISMYPNPATSAIRFNGATVVGARIFDMAGKLLVDASTVMNNEVSVATLANGMYQVVIETAQGIQTQKLVIRK